MVPRLTLIQIDPDAAPACDGTDAQCLQLRAILFHYSLMPELMSQRELRLDGYWRVVLRASIAAARADERALAVAHDDRWPVLHVIVALITVGVGMAAVGFVVGAVAD